MLWLRVTPAEVKVELGSQIVLPQGRKIPIRADGTVLVDPKAARKARRMNLNELLLAAQTREKNGMTTAHLENIHDQIVLARTPANPFSPPDVFAATIATIQSNHYVRRVSWIFDVGNSLVTALAGFCTVSPKTSSSSAPRIDGGVLPGGARHYFAMGH
jgi:hypothetical protein